MADGGNGMQVAVIPGHLPFLDVLARRWMERAPGAGSADGVAADPLFAARGMVILPTRRAARSLGEAFLRRGGGRPMLLPRVVALGAIDEAPLVLAGELELPPAVEPMRRLGALSRLVLAAGGRFGTADSLDQAWPLAQALAELMDEAERVDCVLADKLPQAVDRFAEHWQVTLEFLAIVTAAWPDWLAENGVMNPVARQMAVLRAQARAWEEAPPPHPVWAAGFTTALPAEAELLRAVAMLPAGMLLLQGLDPGPFAGCDQVLAGTLAARHWDALPASHPEAGVARMLRRVGVRREDLRCWDDAAHFPQALPPNRPRMLSRVLLPEQALGDWMADRDPVALDGMSRLAGADGQEEAGAIALAMRAALERPGAQAALVTPDRALARRVAVELRRWGVAVDDSAGESLADTPPAVLLRLLVEAVANGLSPVALLALLKHPLAAGGMAPAAFRFEARRLERFVLRGPAPAPGFAGLRRAVNAAADAAGRTERPEEA
ncbi:MAG: double-strand break repair protein AddB, partial [Gluconacetobacter diazotrophicus]|nr:double-strand break repair protein AddB [Gluconacetobacter diazotrophicus]